MITIQLTQGVMVKVMKLERVGKLSEHLADDRQSGLSSTVTDSEFGQLINRLGHLLDRSKSLLGHQGLL